jgi:hypothetical protein
LYLIFLLLLYPHYNYAQSAAPNDSTILKLKVFLEQLYGADYNLINGRRYVNLYPTAEGHPYFGEDKFYRGYIVINNISYTNVEIKYDICNQKIILQYPHFSGNKDIIILNGEFIEEFEINGRSFRKYTFPGTGPRFYQIISPGNLSCLYHWEKQLLKGLSVETYFKYSPEKRLSYLVIDNKLCPFNSRKSFLKLLPQEHNTEIKIYLRSYKIWIRNASDFQIRQLMDYCNELIRQE